MSEPILASEPPIFYSILDLVGDNESHCTVMASTELAPEYDNPSIVHVCTFSVRQYAERLACMSGWLSPDEQARAQRFLKEADRMRFVLGRAMVRRLCGAYLRIEPARVRLDHTLTGKPYLANSIPVGRKRFEFNVAHSGDCGLVAWTEGQAVGFTSRRSSVMGPSGLTMSQRLHFRPQSVPHCPPPSPMRLLLYFIAFG